MSTQKPRVRLVDENERRFWVNLLGTDIIPVVSTKPKIGRFDSVMYKLWRFVRKPVPNPAYFELDADEFDFKTRQMILSDTAEKRKVSMDFLIKHLKDKPIKVFARYVEVLPDTAPIETKKCPICDAVIPVGVKYCPVGGHKLEDLEKTKIVSLESLEKEAKAPQQVSVGFEHTRVDSKPTQKPILPPHVIVEHKAPETRSNNSEEDLRTQVDNLEAELHDTQDMVLKLKHEKEALEKKAKEEQKAEVIIRPMDLEKHAQEIDDLMDKVGDFFEMLSKSVGFKKAEMLHGEVKFTFDNTVRKRKRKKKSNGREG